MRIKNDKRTWHIVYVCFCVIYTAWIVWVGRYDFTKIQREYRHTERGLEATALQKEALKELRLECREKLSRSKRTKQQKHIFTGEGKPDQRTVDPCASFLPEELAEKKISLHERLTQHKKGVRKRLIIFSVSFLFFFVLLPLLFVYLVAFAAAKVFRAVKVVR